MRSNLTLVVLLMSLAAGCGKNQSDAPLAEPSAGGSTAAVAAVPPAEEARTTFKTICATCHGDGGLGNGPAAPSLTPKPRNYTDKTWQASVTDDQITKTILMGGAAVGKSPIMPAQPQLKEKPEVVAAMVQIIRGFGK
jgi:cytochrome c553